MRFSGQEPTQPLAEEMCTDGTSGSMRPTAVDLFSGAGGATQGLIDAGFDVVGAVEFDATAAATYRLNHKSTQLWERDIRNVSAAEVKRELGLKTGDLTLLKACPPCQGFSTLAEGRIQGDDPRNDLVIHTVRFVRALRPRAVLVENVPGLSRDRRSTELLAALNRMGYNARAYYVNAVEFGVPQRRKRLIILALRGKRTPLPQSLTTTDPETPVTVRDAFRQLEADTPANDPLGTHRILPEMVLRRVQAIPAGGNRHDLPEHLQLDCHKKLAADKKSGASGSYGRLRWDEPAPTMTTRCTTPACGSFLHPEEHRPITLREAAAIQTFPPDYKFAGTRSAIERQIGNAVPVLMAARIASALLNALEGGAA
ncbi:MAG: DNA cytosine methyltransferase [Propionicimonas sp.]